MREVIFTNYASRITQYHLVVSNLELLYSNRFNLVQVMDLQDQGVNGNLNFA